MENVQITNSVKQLWKYSLMAVFRLQVSVIPINWWLVSCAVLQLVLLVLFCIALLQTTYSLTSNFGIAVNTSIFTPVCFLVNHFLKHSPFSNLKMHSFTRERGCLIYGNFSLTDFPTRGLVKWTDLKVCMMMRIVPFRFFFFNPDLFI